MAFDLDLDKINGGQLMEKYRYAALKVLTNCYVEPYAAEVASPYLQFQRIGYFTQDKHSTPQHLVFNRTVGLKDGWTKK